MNCLLQVIPISVGTCREWKVSVNKFVGTLAVLVATLICTRVTSGQASGQAQGFVKPVTPNPITGKPLLADTISWRPINQEAGQSADAPPATGVPGQDEPVEDAVEDDDESLKSQAKPFTKWPPKPLSDIRVDIRTEVRNAGQVVPRDRAQDLVFTNRNDWTAFQPGLKVFSWAAPNVRYQLLYFEDIALERYGQAHGDVVQFAASTVHFFGSAAFLPYAMLVDHPRSCDYPLGYCRPGDLVPATRQKFFYGWHPRK